MFAMVPPAALTEQIQRERMLFAENYNCVKALKPPVHITIYDPFKQEGNFEVRITTLQNWADKQQPFSIILNNYGFFEPGKSPVIYIHVDRSKEIVSLRTGLLLQLKKYLEQPETGYLPNNKAIPDPKPKPYHPHITIGYRDVPHELLPDIKQAYSRRPFKGKFECKAIYLWRHDGKNWQTVQEFKLNGNSIATAAPTLF